MSDPYAIGQQIGLQIGQVLDGALKRIGGDPLEAEFAARLAIENSEALEYIVERETEDIRQELDRLSAELKKKPMAFRLEVTKTEGGLMRKVLAKSGARTIEFTIDRTDDGFPSAVSAKEA